MKTPKTVRDLRIEAETRTLDRVKAESPSIKDTPRRRFTVFQAELAVLASEHHLPVLDAEIEDLASEFAFGLPAVENVPEMPAVEPPKQDETPVSNEN